MSKIITGTVKSLKMAKTATIEVATTKTHPLYKKIIKGVKKYHAHYNNLELKVGDNVQIKEIKPISKTKTWLVIKKI